jgi:hypothetical protein
VELIKGFKSEPNIHDQLIFNKVTKKTQWERTVSSINDDGKFESHMQKNLKQRQKSIQNG